MKKIIFVFLMSVLWSATYAQGGNAIAIKGLHNPKKLAKISVISIELLNANTPNQAYRIVKNLDKHSQKISEAIQTSKTFPKAFAKYDGIDGEIRKELDTVYLSDYSMSSSGNAPATETFLVHFATQNTTEN